MTAFTDHSISLREELARTTSNDFDMTRRGYALATRRTAIGELIDALHDGYAAAAEGVLRIHGAGDCDAYVPHAGARSSWVGPIRPSPPSRSGSRSWTTDFPRRLFMVRHDSIRA